MLNYKLSKSFIFSELPQDLQSFLAWLTESKDGHVTPSMYSIEEPEDFSAIKYNIQNDGGKININNMYKCSLCVILFERS